MNPESMSSQLAPDRSSVGDGPGLVPSRAGSVDLSALARVGTALADDTRRRMLVSLLDGAAYPSDLAADLGLTRSNVSNHLACLRGCGLVVADPEGRRLRYRLSDPKLAHALSDLCGLVLAPPVGCEHEVGR
jgi:DNA-binding transcriptional ArsR family regulator